MFIISLDESIEKENEQFLNDLNRSQVNSSSSCISNINESPETLTTQSNNEIANMQSKEINFSKFF